MIVTVVALVVVFFSVITALYFILPHLSPIPFYPTRSADVPRITTFLLQNQPTHVVDLGAGTGRVIFAALKHARVLKLSPILVALEINPLLIVILHLRRLLHARHQKAHVIWGNFFNINLMSLFRTDETIQGGKPDSRHFAIYIYGTPAVMNAIARKFSELPKDTIIVSYYLRLPAWEGKRIAHVKGVHDIYVYRR